MVQLLNKGFLGPIGDDLPSLIPLLFALLIFFATFSFSYTTFSQKNTGFQRDLDVLNIARVLKGTNYISGYVAFQDACNSLNPTNVKYRAVITNYFTAPWQYLNKYHGFSLSADDDAGIKDAISNTPLKSYELKPFVDSGDNTLKCIAPSLNGLDPDPDVFEKNPFVVKIYPLVVEDNRIVKPMHLVVVAWTQ